MFDKFQKATESLLRETKNYRLDSPYEVASYNSRLLMEEDVYYLDNYVNDMEGEYAESVVPKGKHIFVECIVLTTTTAI